MSRFNQQTREANDKRSIRGMFVLCVLALLWLNQVFLAFAGEDTYQLAVLAFQKGHFDEVLRLLATLPAEEAERPAPYNLKALALMELHRYDEALLASQHARVLDPNNVNYICNAGIIYLAKRDFLGAENTFRLGIQRFPQSSRLYEGWGEALLAVRRFEEAELRFRKAAELDPTSCSAQVALAKLFYATGDGEQLGAPASRAVQLDPDNYLACYYYGKYLLEYSDLPARGREYIQRSITLSPDFVDGLIAWGTILSSEGRWEEAAQAYERGLVRDPRDSRLYYRLFTAYRKLGRLEKSEWALDQYNKFVDPTAAQIGPAGPQPSHNP